MLIRVLAPLSGVAALVFSSLDGFHAALLVYSVVLVSIIATYAQHNLKGQVKGSRYQRFGLLLAIAVLGILAAIISRHLVIFAAGWSLSGWAAALLVNHAKNEQSKAASRYTFAWFLVGDLALWSALFIGSNKHLLDNPRLVSNASLHKWQLLVAILIAISGVIRSGLFPVTRWLILTSEAPSPLSALLHAGIVNGFGILVINFPVSYLARYFIVPVALTTIFLCLATMRHRHDEKGKLANGTSMQMAFMMLEAMSGAPGIVALHIIGHGLYKSWSFMRAGGAPLRSQMKKVLSIPTSHGDRHLRSYAIALVTALAILATQTIHSEYMLNLAVGVIAATSALLFSLQFPWKKAVALVAVTLIGLVLYLVVINAIGSAFKVLWPAPTDLLVFSAIGVVAVTVVTQNLPRPWTMKVTARQMRSHFTKRQTKRLAEIPATSQNPLDEALISELVGAASAPFVPGRNLSEIVAIDPIAGLHTMDYVDADQLLKSYGVSLYLPPSKYLSLLEQGLIDREHLHAQLDEVDSLEGFIEQTRTLIPQETSQSKNLSAAAGIASWWSSQAWHNGDHGVGAYSLWRQSLPLKAQFALPADAKTAHTVLLPALAGGEPSATKALAILQQLISLDMSWFGYVRAFGDEAIHELLALRAAIALSLDADFTPAAAPEFSRSAEIWQKALESSQASKFKEMLSQSHRETRDSTKLAIVTCIDVRSDVIRGSAEEIEGVATFGMAGFFGIDLALRKRDEAGNLNFEQDFCPIILQPSLALETNDQTSVWKLLPYLWSEATRGSGALAMAEGFGIGCGILSTINTFAPRLAHRLFSTIAPNPWPLEGQINLSSIPLEARVSAARGILQIVPVDQFDEVVFVGHASRVPNSPFRSMYECGACGGKSGALNAQVAAALFQDPEVIAALGFSSHRVRIFAAVHDTTLGSIALAPAHSSEVALQKSDRLVHLNSALQKLPVRILPNQPASTRSMERNESGRFAWWQVFPEWGLVGNFACVIGSRALTKSIDLGSRVFLHDYNWKNDLDGSILAGILSGPGVVMQMINAQYNISITSAEHFSSFDKTRHNVMGEAGVLLGSQGRLYRGMPWQAVGTSDELHAHLPSRIRFFIDAPQELIDQALSQTNFNQLLAGGWVSVESLL